jgi:hypothetical protein
MDMQGELTMRILPITTLAILGVLSAGASPAVAYVGPGAGLSAIGSVIAFLGVIGLIILGFVWYPLKRLLKGRRAGAAAHNDKADETQ